MSFIDGGLLLLVTGHRWSVRIHTFGKNMYFADLNPFRRVFMILIKGLLSLKLVKMRDGEFSR